MLLACEHFPKTKAHLLKENVKSFINTIVVKHIKTEESMFVHSFNKMFLIWGDNVPITIDLKNTTLG